MSTAALSFGVLVAVSLGAISSHAAPDERVALAKIDRICHCAGLIRRSGVLHDPESRRLLGLGTVRVYAAADGRTEKYIFDFGRVREGDTAERGPDFRARDIVGFLPADYRLGGVLPPVHDAQQRQFCIQALSRLKKCGLEWPRFGRPMVETDRPRGYRVRYRSRPSREEGTVWSMDGSTYFAMTPRETIFAVWIGE